MNIERLKKYAKSELDVLSETYSEEEALAYIHRFKGQIDMLMFSQVISPKEAEELYDELQIARTKAEKNINSKK
ncbi:TPA: hypothetical protein OTZ50_004406 [Aeromonas hydrophila]|nr:hypothetical protein [Aeromonas hydrophila]